MEDTFNNLILQMTEEELNSYCEALNLEAKEEERKAKDER